MAGPASMPSGSVRQSPGASASANAAEAEELRQPRRLDDRHAQFLVLGLGQRRELFDVALVQHHALVEQENLLRARRGQVLRQNVQLMELAQGFAQNRRESADQREAKGGFRQRKPV